jgi:hypothetical protein
MIEDAIDPRPAQECFAQLIGTNTAILDALRIDPESLARNWNDRASAWGNLRDFRHWIERARG